jgi:uncharacterized protein (DUF433 family)
MSTNKVRIPSGTTHISLDERGRAWVDGTNFRVDQVVAGAIGPDQMTPQQIVEAYPQSNLTLARIYAALAWYYDHQAEMDAEFERVRQMVEEGRVRQRNSPLVQRVLALKAARKSSDPETQS